MRIPIPDRRGNRGMPLVLAALAVGIGLVAAGHLAARADHGGVSAHFGGIDASRRTQPVLTVFNAQAVAEPVDVDVVLRNAEGEILAEVEDVFSLESYQSGSLNLWDVLTADLPRRTRPYQGLLAVEVHSDSVEFREGGVVVHVTEFFANPRKPRAAILFRPLFVLADDG